MLDKYLEKLEFNKIIENLLQYAKTYIGKKYCNSIYPYTEKNKVIKALDETNEAVILRYKKGNIPIYEISEDIEICLKTLSSNKVLSISNILNIGKILKLSNDLKSYFFSDELINLNDFSTLYNYFDNLYVNKDIENKIFSTIIDEYTLDDKASNNLFNIRTTKRKIEQEKISPTLLTKNQSFILGYLRHEGKKVICQKDIEQELSIRRSTTSEMLKRMEQKQLTKLFIVY